MKLTLFDFQQEDLEHLTHNGLPSKNALIANEMGTGKTFEAGARDLMIREKIGDGNTLVVAPSSVLPAWEAFFRDFTDLKTVSVNPKKRQESWQSFVNGDAHVWLIHWECLRLIPEMAEVEWLHVIVDECHRMKNRKAQQTRALKAISKVGYRSALSGTPVVNRPDEYWSVLNWLDPKRFGSFWRFYERYVDYQIVYPQGFKQIVGPKNQDELLGFIEPYYVRRLKKDVVKDLPDKYYSTIWVDLAPEQRKAYNSMKEHMIAWIGAHEDSALVAPVVIAQLTRLQQFAVAFAQYDAETGKVALTDPSTKLDAFMQILEDNPDEQIVLFSRFKSLVNLAAKRLKEAGISYVVLTGDVPQSERGSVVDKFQKGEAKVFLGTLGAGGVGITLTAASTIVFTDRDWSPAINAQAEDRLHRIGQKNAVQVIDIMAKGTVDLGRNQRLEQKWSWIRALLGDK